MKTLAFNCPSPTKSLQSKLAWRQYFNEGLTVIIKHYCCRRECVVVCGTVRAHFTTTTHFMWSDQRKHQHILPHLCQVSVSSSVRSQLPFFFLTSFSPGPGMSSLLREEMQRVLFRPGKQRLVEFIEIEEPTHGRHFLCASGKQLFCWCVLLQLFHNIFVYLIKFRQFFRHSHLFCM